MKKSEIERVLRQCFRENTVPDADRGGREALLLAARQTYRVTEKEQRISFWKFVAYQIKFTGWSVWGMQTAVLAAIYLALYLTVNGDFAYLWERRLPVLLCFSSMFLLLPALPAIARSLPYGMAEVEQASRFSAIHLLTARLVIISAGDILMLAVMVMGIVLGMGQSLGAVMLYLLVPFFLLGSIYITIALHVDTQHVFRICLAVGTWAAVTFWILFHYHYGFYEHSFQTGWAAVCAAAVICDIIQLRRAERKGAAEALL